jgi:hypothetical protein
MNTLMIGYDLNRESGSSRGYESLIAAIKESNIWWHHLDRTWLVRTSLSATAMRDKLSPFIDANDELLVIDVTGDAAAWKGFSDRGSGWIKDNL